MIPPELREGVPLAPHTTLGVGGPADGWAEVRTPERLAAVLEFARERGLPVQLLGGGSNVLVADAGLRAVVVRYLDQSLSFVDTSSCTEVTCGAGVVWAELVERCVQRGLAGIECLGGIPGLAGAAPMQNIGAYGQEVGEVLRSVSAIDLATGARRVFWAAECGLGYRTSYFKESWANRYLITTIQLKLQRDGAPTLRYAELQRVAGGCTSLAEVAQHVLALRRRKAMVLDPAEPDSRSAGSFFTNPILGEAEAAAVDEAARAATGQSVPSWPAGEGRRKLAAAWLIERSGTRKGERCGGAAVSSRHTLALTNPGEATAADVVALASRIRGRVRDAFGVTLDPEPRFLGFESDVNALLG